MKIFPIASSSSGNCTIVEIGDTLILIDCGVTLKKLKEHIGDLNRIDAVFITHEHGDHINGVGPLSRKIDCKFYVNQLSVKKRPDFFKDCKNLENLDAGDEIVVNGLLKVLAFSTKHDSAYSVGFVLSSTKGGKKFGYLTDTGFITPMMSTIMKDCSAVFIEADYDEKLLQESDKYDDYLKERIASNFGHLSNEQTAEFLESTLDLGEIDFVMLGHLSANTNSPKIVKDLLENRFPDYTEKFHIAPLMEALFLELED